MGYKVLLVDDDTEVLQLNAKYLAGQGFEVKVTSHPAVVISALKEFRPDCVVLDIMMPEISGMELAKRIRKGSAVPIIFLSGKTSEDDRIDGLMIGADDYITKPYSLRELAARITAVCRRKAPVVESPLLNFPPLSIDKMKHKVFCNGEEISLSNREFELLIILVDRRDKTVSFEEISKLMWGSYSEADRRSIMVNSSRLRKKFEGYEGADRMIETVWGVGYVFKSGSN